MRVHAVLGEEDYQAFRGTAMGSHHWVQVQRHVGLESPVSALRAAGYQLVAAHLADDAVDFRRWITPGPPLSCWGRSAAG